MANYTIRYEDVSPTAKGSAEYDAEHVENYADYKDAFKRDGVNVQNVATLENNFWRLDGSKKLFPNNPLDYEWGYVSDVISGANGIFEIQPKLIINIADRATTPALTLSFDTINNEYPSDVNISYYNNNNLIISEDYQPTSVTFCFVAQVEAYDKVVITFKATNVPYRRVRVTQVFYGVMRFFDYDELQSLTALEELNPISTELSINTMQFDVRNTSPIPFLFQKMQRLFMYEDSKLFGTYYTDTSQRKDINFYSLQCIDAIGVLDRSQHYGGMYNKANVVDVIDDIFKDTNLKYTIADSLKDKTVSGYIPIGTKRESLLYVLFAIGAVADTGRTSKVNIFELSDETVNEFGDDTTFMNGREEIESRVTSVTLSSWSYSQTAEEADEIFNGTLTQGNHVILFDSPYYNVQVTNATIIKSNANYCEIDVPNEGTVTIKGFSYTENEKTHTLTNPFTIGSDVLNEKKSNACKLINEDNVVEILQKYYDYITLMNKVTAKVIINDEKVGDIINARTVYNETIKMRIESINFTFGNQKFAEIGGKVIE